MRELPILFKGPQVRAILDGRKTQTRRLVSERTSSMGCGHVRDVDLGRAWVDPGGTIFGPGPYLKAPVRADEPEGRVFRVYPRVEPGDMLWVRETHAIVPATAYRASREEDGSAVPHRVSPDGEHWAVYRAGWSRVKPSRWRPSIHMPRWASRLTLRVTEVRVERLQDISEEDARAEGIGPRDGDGHRGYVSARDVFAVLWNNLADAATDWQANPWVWAIGFEVAS